jgi:hypothetical protein
MIENSTNKIKRLSSRKFRINTRDDQWVTTELLSYTRKKTYGGTSTSDSPDDLIGSLAIPINTILSVQAIKDQRY